MSGMTPEYENDLLLTALTKEIEAHEVTKKALASAVADVERFKANRQALAAMLVDQAQFNGSEFTITLNEASMKVLKEIANPTWK